MDQFVRAIMRQGKLATAQKHTNLALTQLSRLPPVQLASSTTSTTTTTGSVLLFEQALEKIAPLVKTTSSRLGSRIVLAPKPLSQRQRMRLACVWVGQLASKNTCKQPLGLRIAGVVKGVLDGTSPLIQKRDGVHKQALANRSNLVLQDRKAR